MSTQKISGVTGPVELFKLSPMHPMLAFYKQTWWLWLLFMLAFVALSRYVSAVFLVMIPGLIGYSIYFGIVRTSELAEQANSESPPE